MDRELSPEIIRKRRIRTWGTIAAVVVVLIGIFWGFRTVLKGRVERSKVKMSVAEIGRIEAAISASGVVVPGFEQVVTSPVRAKINRVLHNAGTPIEVGESIVELNFEETLSRYEKLRDEYALKKTRLTQLNLGMERSLIDMEAAHDVKMLRIKSLKTKLDDEQYLKTVGGGTDDRIEQAEINLQVSERELKQLQSQINNKKASHQADLEALQLEMVLLRRDVDELKKKIDRAAISAERGGMITWVNDQIGNWISEGEQVARIADLSSFKVQGTIAETYADQLRAGGRVNVRINETDLPGVITRVNPTVENGMLTFFVQLDQSDHELLRPNLRTDVFVITSFIDEAVRVKNGPFFDGATRKDVFVVEGNVAIRRELVLGESNFDFVEVKSGLEKGETIIISDMEKHLHLDEIKLIEK